MKSEISALKSQIAQLEMAKRGSQLSNSLLGRNTNYTLHTAPGQSSKPQVEIAEGMPDLTIGFREMQVLAVQY